MWSWAQVRVFSNLLVCATPATDNPVPLQWAEFSSRPNIHSVCTFFFSFSNAAAQHAAPVQPPQAITGVVQQQPAFVQPPGIIPAAGHYAAGKPQTNPVIDEVAKKNWYSCIQKQFVVKFCAISCNDNGGSVKS
jgi:hypothetical protein